MFSNDHWSIHLLKNIHSCMMMMCQVKSHSKVDDVFAWELVNNNEIQTDHV